jgi:predicted Zn finger-like uncharacterized protein
MIIECINCNKKFEIDQNLIPENGRLVQCSSCNHKWFFKNEFAIKDMQIPTSEKLQENNLIDANNKNIQTQTIIPTEKIIKKIKIKKANNLLSLSIVFIISFVALIVLLDTFKNVLGKIVPNLEFLLYNLFESIKDIRLFIIDLI